MVAKNALFNTIAVSGDKRICIRSHIKNKSRKSKEKLFSTQALGAFLEHSISQLQNRALRLVELSHCIEKCGCVANQKQTASCDPSQINYHQGHC
jgi:hypothetical protein